jgi:hypothetical protein
MSFKILLARSCFTLCLLGAAFAQAPAEKPPTLKLHYDSAFTNYRAHNDQQIGSWKDANDTVTRIGGWREYLKEAQRPAQPSSAPAVPATPASTPRRP